MPITVTMPRLSDTMQQGTIVRWAVKEGQKVKSGDVIADIETDKATMELQSFDDGTVARLAVAPGQAVPVGTLIMVLAAAGEDLAAAAGATAAPAKAAAAGSAAPASAPTSSTAVMDPPRASASHSTNGQDRVFASPLARKIAEEAGVDLGRLQGSGPAGRIIRKDVEEAIAGGQRVPAPAPTSRPAPVPAAGAALASRRVPLSNMRRVIAQRLVESAQSIPHYQVSVEVDMAALADLRQQLNDQLGSQGVKLSVNDFLVRACALAMHQHPYINTRWNGAQGQEAIEYLADVNIGVAIALPVQPDGTGGGLVVATLRAADQMGLRQISSQSKALSEKARARGLSPQEMSDSTFTISNLGMFGVSHFTAIINPPNAAILAVGAALDRPVVKNGQLVPGKVMTMTLSSDHRLIDGAMAAQYLATVRELLEKPATLLV
ncbi:MAG: 2-oxo acid dehydrogenase subunit E2 [Phycisphaerales bacterium]|nr:2-oxo acid dehydrogenase subunit E2 [Phycisphaerales bacterium]